MKPDKKYGRSAAAIRLAAGIAAAVSLAGCGGSPFYNARLDETASAAQEHYTAAKLLEVIPARKDNQAALLKTELEAVVRITAAEADADLSALLEQDKGEATLASQFIRNKIAARYDQITGSKCTAPDRDPLACLNEKVEKTGARFEDAEAKDAISKMLLSRYQDVIEKAVTCESVREETGGEPGSDEYNLWAEAVAACDARKLAYAQYEQIMGSGDGLQGLLGKELETAQQAIKKSKQDAFLEVARFRRATCAIETGAETLKMPGIENFEIPADAATVTDKMLVSAGKLTCAASPLKGSKKESDQKPSDRFNLRVAEAKEIIGKVQESANLGAKAFSELGIIEARLDSLDTFLTSLSTDPQPDEGDGADEVPDRASQFAAAFLDMADEIYEMSRKDDAPPVNALLIEKRRLEVNKAFAEQRVAIEEQKVKLIAARQKAIELELSLLRDALKYARWACADVASAACVLNKKLSGMPADAKGYRVRNLAGLIEAELPSDSKSLSERDFREYLETSLAYYYLSVALGQGQYRAAAWQEVALSYELSMQASNASIALWNAIIEPQVNQLATYHSGGIRPEKLAELIALTATAVGVNE
ncbi:hypothetical protein [Gimibacter soli]|uniref:Lipoprotein n=1 Tax=Gimibacter soli TaxID=3024400 RepID=A0AAF0BL93_9PROT|nr:hypothetical protein [Gimibacter soli]WCL53867.1 hypothetical protein PH603_15115 [Gimibacter soli]